MSNPENPDKLPFDLQAFNQAAMARAHELSTEVGRLAIFEIPDDAGSYDTVYGAVYNLPDNRRIEVKHSVDTDDDFTSSLRIFHTSEIVGADQRQRRLTTVRAIEHSKDPMMAGIEHELAVDEWEQADQARISQTVAKSELAWKSFYEQRTLHHMASMLAGGQPPEIIEATTKVIVEYLLPNGRSYANELINTNAPIEQQEAHNAARRTAGESGNQNAYTVDEHLLVMTLLTGITNPRQVAEPLEDPRHRLGWST